MKHRSSYNIFFVEETIFLKDEKSPDNGENWEKVCSNVWSELDYLLTNKNNPDKGKGKGQKERERYQPSLLFLLSSLCFFSLQTFCDRAANQHLHTKVDSVLVNKVIKNEANWFCRTLRTNVCEKKLLYLFLFLFLIVENNRPMPRRVENLFVLEIRDEDQTSVNFNSAVSHSHHPYSLFSGNLLI